MDFLLNLCTHFQTEILITLFRILHKISGQNAQQPSTKAQITSGKIVGTIFLSLQDTITDIINLINIASDEGVESWRFCWG